MPLAEDIASLTVSDALAALDTKRITSQEYVQTLRERIAAHNPALNAVLFINDSALQEAERLDKLRAEGKLLGPLHGIPMLIKDNVDVAGIPTTGATPSLRSNVPSQSAPVVKALQNAGVIVLGKTNLSELASSYSTCNTSFAGVCHNPYNLDHITGGSSGGSGASVAAGFAPAALFTDTFGSTRCPSLCHGIYGFRPTHGRYPTTGLIPLVSMFDTVGPGARSVADLLILDSVMSGDDATQTKVDATSLRVGIPRKFFYDGLTPDVAKAIESSLAQLETAGVTLIAADLPVDVSENFEAMFALATESFVRDFDAYLDAAIADPLNPLKQKLKTIDVIEQIANPVSQGFWRAFNNPAPPAVLAAARQKRADQMQSVSEVFAGLRLDCLFYPGSPSTALPLSAGDMAGMENYKGRYNVAPFNALPACAIPIALGSDGLPIGAEVLGAPASDRRALAIAQLFEGILGHIPPPTLPAV